LAQTLGCSVYRRDSQPTVFLRNGL
jgi:hypothetical protein